MGITCVGDRVVIVGGEVARDGIVNIVECMGPRGQWEVVTNMSTRKAGLAAVELCDERMLVMGGWDENYNALNTVEMYATHTNEWSAIPAMQYSRSGLRAAVIGNDVYVVGGSDGTQKLSRSEVFDLGAGVWQTAAPMVCCPSAFALAAVDGVVLVAGGFGTFEPLDVVERLDPRRGQWDTLAHLPAPRGGCCGVALDSSFFVLGGGDTGVAVLYVRDRCRFPPDFVAKMNLEIGSQNVPEHPKSENSISNLRGGSEVNKLPFLRTWGNFLT